MLRDTNMTKYFYPDGYMVLEHDAFMALDSNVKFLMVNHSDMLMSGDVTSRDAGFSIGGLISVNDGITWRYNFNYNGATSVDTCKQHLRHQLYQNMNEISKRDETYLIIMVPIEFMTAYGQDKLLMFWKSMFGVPSGDIESFKQYAFCYKEGHTPNHRL